jgi:hypothetical protein
MTLKSNLKSHPTPHTPQRHSTTMYSDDAASDCHDTDCDMQPSGRCPDCCGLGECTTNTGEAAQLHRENVAWCAKHQPKCDAHEMSHIWCAHCPRPTQPELIALVLDESDRTWFKASCDRVPRSMAIHKQ